MSGNTDLQHLMGSLNPVLSQDEFVLLCLPHDDPSGFETESHSHHR